MDHFISTAVGTQWVGDFAKCRCDRALLKRSTILETACEKIVSASGLQIMGRAFHQFAPEGATGLFLLAESHLAIHTWPEFASVAIDLYVCNVTEDNSEKAKGVFEKLVALFAPEHCQHQVIHRGGVALHQQALSTKRGQSLLSGCANDIGFA
jgi:S-adenosylmethionine decarboxylase proenzyme